MTPSQTPDRRAALGLAAAGAVAVGAGRAAAQSATRLPELYPGQNARNFRSLQRHENTHVQYLVDALGSSARPRPTFQNLLQPDIRTFATVTLALENTGTGAYLGAAPAIFSRQYLDAALSIAEIEARHCGYVNHLLNRLMSQNVFGTEQNFETPLTQQQVRELAGPFIVDLAGGPPLEFSAVPSRANDIAILNFALALEYLEQEFYNVNVPRFFPS